MPIRRGRQKGLSLIELMVAMILGLLLVLVIGNVYLAGRQSFRDQDESARVQETGRFVLDMISRVVMETGRADISPDNTLLTYAGISGAGLALDGTNGAGGTPDTLIVRYSSANAEWDCQGTNTNGSSAAPVVVTQTLTVAGDNLQCGSNISGINRSIASNVEDFQVTFGLDNDGDGSVDQYVLPSTANAPNARAVRVCVLIRTGIGVSPGGQQYLDCNGATVTAAAGDTRMRRAFTKVIGLRNRLG